MTLALILIFIGLDMAALRRRLRRLRQHQDPIIIETYRRREEPIIIETYRRRGTFYARKNSTTRTRY
jgi:hypothetical protein